MIRRLFSELLDRLAGEVTEIYGNRLVTLAVFGSVGRGTPGPNSDVDVLLVANPLPNGRMKRLQEFAAVEERLEDYLRALKTEGIDTYIAPLFKTPGEVALGSPIFFDMVDGVRILYDKEDFFNQYLRELKAKLENLGAHKVRYRGAWYWDLKPDFKKGEVIEL